MKTWGAGGGGGGGFHCIDIASAQNKAMIITEICKGPIPQLKALNKNT